MKAKSIILMLLMLLPVLTACNDTDNVQSIFTKHTWKLTYITQKNKQAWYKFVDVTEATYKQYDPVTGSKSFTIDFSGNSTDGIISGDMSGTGVATVSGTYTANGKSRAFSANVKSSSANDALAKKIVEGIKTATSYAGDNNNLYLYFDYQSSAQHEGVTLCLVFAPVK